MGDIRFDLDTTENVVANVNVFRAPTNSTAITASLDHSNGEEMGVDVSTVGVEEDARQVGPTSTSDTVGAAAVDVAGFSNSSGGSGGGVVVDADIVKGLFPCGSWLLPALPTEIWLLILEFVPVLQLGRPMGEPPSLEVAHDLRLWKLHHTVELNSFYSSVTANRQAREIAKLRAENALQRDAIATAKTESQSELGRLTAAVDALTALVQLKLEQPPTESPL